MKKSVLLTMTVLLLMSVGAYGGVTYTIKGFISDQNGNQINGIGVQAISGSGQVLTWDATADSKGYTLTITVLPGTHIRVVPSHSIQIYDFITSGTNPLKEYSYPIYENKNNQNFKGYNDRMPLGPTIVSPTKNKITSSNPTFIWNKLNVPKYYAIHISSLLTLKDTIYYKDSIPKTDTSFTLPLPHTLISSTTYYFQILSITYPPTGKKTGPSDTINFKTDVNTHIIIPNKEKNILFSNSYYSKDKDINIKYYDFKGRAISKSIHTIKNSGYYSVMVSATDPTKKVYISF